VTPAPSPPERVGSPEYLNSLPSEGLPEACRVSGFWKLGIDGITVIYRDRDFTLPKGFLELILNDYELAALALRGASGLVGKELKCLLDSLKRLALQLRLEEAKERAAEEVRGRRPSLATIIARLVADKMLLTLNGLTDMASEVTYIFLEGEVLWGNEADGFLEKRAGELGAALAEELAERAFEDPKKLRSVVTINVIREAVKAYKRETMIRSEELAKALKPSLNVLKYKGGSIEVEEWFRSGVLRSVRRPSLHVLPQEAFDVSKFLLIMRTFDGLEAVEAVAEEFVPELLEAVDSWVTPRYRGLLWKAIGYTIYPKMPFRKFFVLLGPSGSGKSTFLEFLHEALGSRNVASVTLGQLLGPRGEYYAAELKHKLANLADEGLGNERGSPELLKALVGGSYVTARTLYSKPFKFKNYAKMFFATNNEEAVGLLERDPAIKRRIIIIRFENSFPDNWKFKELLIAASRRSLPVMLAALRLLAEEGFGREDEELLRVVKELCKKKCAERRDGLFLPASELRGLGVSAKELWERLRSLGIPCKYTVWHGRRGLVLPASIIEGG